MATIMLYANKMSQMPRLIHEVKTAVGDYKSQLSSFQTKVAAIDKSVCNLDDVISSIQTSTRTQEEKIIALDAFRQECERFIWDCSRIDGNVADLINQRKNNFYEKYSYLKPDCEKSGWDKFKDGCKAVGDWCKEHWKLIATIVLVIAAIAVIILCPASALLLMAIAKGILIGAATGGVIGGVFSKLLGGSFWEGFENGAFMGALSGAIGGGMGFALSAGGKIALSLGKVLLIGGVSGAATSLLGDLGDIFIKGSDIPLGQVLLNMTIYGSLGVLFAGVGYAVSKGFTALKLKFFPERMDTYNPVNKGPLPDEVANTFRSGTYREVVTQGETTLYRVYGGKSEAISPYWTATEPRGPLQSVIDSALDQSWGNTATNVTTIKVPPGTTIYQGYAAPQGSLVGGGSQVYIPEVNPSWVVP